MTTREAGERLNLFIGKTRDGTLCEVERVRYDLRYTTVGNPDGTLKHKNDLLYCFVHYQCASFGCALWKYFDLT